jgi:hypothetical protein
MTAVVIRVTTLIFKAEVEIRLNPNAPEELLIGNVSIPEKVFFPYKGASELTLASGYLEAGQRSINGHKGLQRCIYSFAEGEERYYYIPSAYLVGYIEK